MISMRDYMKKDFVCQEEFDRERNAASGLFTKPSKIIRNFTARYGINFNRYYSLKKEGFKVNLNSKIFPGILSHLWVSLRGNGLAQKYADVEPPLRAELFSADQMEQHGKTLADSHTLRPGRTPDRLLTRLAENEGILIGVHNLLTEAVKANRRITPAGEWLLDNFYLIEEQIRTARRHLPKGYSRELPRLINGPSAALPRVYDIALEMISHGDGRVDPEILSRFAAAYQTVTALTLGELWAKPLCCAWR